MTLFILTTITTLLFSFLRDISNYEKQSNYCHKNSPPNTDMKIPCYNINRTNIPINSTYKYNQSIYCKENSHKKPYRNHPFLRNHTCLQCVFTFYCQENSKRKLCSKSKKQLKICKPRKMVYEKVNKNFLFPI